MLATASAFLSPQALEHAFYEAISRGDLDALMALWAKQDDIVCIHPGAARLVGAQAIRASFADLFEQGELKVRARQLLAVEHVGFAIHNVIEEVSRDEEMPLDVYLLATNVYINTMQGWRIQLHHVSITPGSAPETRVQLLH